MSPCKLLGISKTSLKESTLQIFGYPGLDVGLTIFDGILVSTLKEYYDFCGGANHLEDVVKEEQEENEAVRFTQTASPKIVYRNPFLTGA